MARSDADLGDEVQSTLDVELLSGVPAPDDMLLPGYLAQWADVAGHLSDRAAAALYDRLQRWPRSVIYTNVAVFGAVASYLGALATAMGRFAEAADHFDQAIEIHDRLGAPFFVARTRLELGRMLRERDAPGDAERAQAMMQEAAALARSFGLAVIERRATPPPSPEQASAG